MAAEIEVDIKIIVQDLALLVIFLLHNSEIDALKDDDSLIDPILHLEIQSELDLLFLNEFEVIGLIVDLLVHGKSDELDVGGLELLVFNVFCVVLFADLEHSRVDHWEVFKMFVFNIEKLGRLDFKEWS